MSEKNSKILLLIETIFFVIPTTLFFLAYGLFMLVVSMPPWESLEKLLLFGILVYCFLSIIAVWRVTTCFYFKGRLGLDNLSYAWKIIGYFGGFYVVISWLLLFANEFLSVDILSMDGLLEMVFFFGLFGTLLLVPLIHLSIEWTPSSRSRALGK